MSKLRAMIEGVFAVDPAADELEFDKVWQTWGDLAAQMHGLDAALTGAGLGAGARVGVILRNRPQMAPVLACLFSTGRCLATLNGNAPDDYLAADVRKVEAPVLLGLAEDWARPGVRAAAQETGAVGLELTGDPEAPVRKVEDVPGDRARWTRPSAPDVAIEMLTSGTTGAPKRIPLASAKFEKALLSAAAYEKGRDEDAAPRLRGGVTIVFAPLAHIAGVTGIMNNLLAGRKICLVDKFSVEAFRDAVARHRPKVVTAPPAALRMIMDADIPKEDLSSLVAYRTGTAPLDPRLADAFYERYGVPVLQNYGATEFAGGAAGWSLDDFKAHWKAKWGSVGRLNRGVEARAVDPETGDPRPPGEEGLLEIRGPNVGDGKTYVRTTDIAVVDADGFLFIKGRFDGAIIRGGFKIMPDDVVNALQQHPSIREAGVTGVADRRLGQAPVAAYILKSGAAAPTEQELKTFLRGLLLPYQVPMKLLQVDELPRTPSLKVSQPGLQALFEALGDEAEA
ncbi:long-chain fatty acid--CoA ligase [Phenylobacterium sp.]|jgi:acyl-CoA synthetase (AMP-forming)/AMP-acid ligase II|uniref:class I adenylate-forming enzyme family protein n=1 Tax=Phenylobacterium sp. TaxID=1871053 RepID=UPI002F42D644